MLIYRLTYAAALLALGLVGHAHADGNRVPAIAYEQRAQSAGAPSVKLNAATPHQPGYSSVIMPPVTSEESERAIWARRPGNLNVGVKGDTPQSKQSKPTYLISGYTAPSAPASIAELARSLRGNADLIYEYVRNNIELVPNWGIQKGAFGALLDNKGTAFDQASLMVALLRQSGYTASFVKGRVNVAPAQARDWFGVDPANICGVSSFLGSTQIPSSNYYMTGSYVCDGSSGLYSVKLDHVWVKVNIGGTNYYFDPSLKPHTQINGIDLASATGYNAASYMTAAKAGATIAADYVQGINRNNIRSNLTTYANNLATYLRANYPVATLYDVIGGRVITPHDGTALRQATLPYQDTTMALTEWTDIPDNYKTTLRIQYQGIDQTLTSDAIYSRRLTLTYNATNQPVLSLDGAALATGTAVTPGTYGNVSMTVTHGAYASTFVNQAFAAQIKAGGTFLIVNAWGDAGRGPIELHRARLDQAIAAGKAAGSEEVLGTTLAVLSSNYIAQNYRANYITDKLAHTTSLFHHELGIAGYNTAAYIDLQGVMVSVFRQDSLLRDDPSFYSASMHGSIFESIAIQQTTGASAVSTVKLLDIAVASNDRIYDANSANYATAVQPNLVGCTGWLPYFQTGIDSGRRLILPARCTLNEGSWTGAGWYSILLAANGYLSVGSMISGNLAGGFSSSTQPVGTTTSNTLNLTTSTNLLMPSTGSTFGDPIDMTKGHYLYSHEDLNTGVGAFPLSLSFARHYTSANPNQRGTLGLGWTSNLLANAKVGSDGFQSLGEDSALDAVGAIVEQLVSLDLLFDPAKPLANMVIATVGQRWFGEQLTDNTVVVRQGLNGEVFVKLPDASYNSPPGNSAKLSRNGDNTYTYETLHRAAINFNTAGDAVTYTHPSGVQARYTYTGGQLSQVSNSLGRALTLAYTSGRVSSVSDGSRTIYLDYDASGNLTTFRNALNVATTYQYDAPGRISKLFYPSNPSAAFVTNTYDSLGRVQTQTNANGKLFTYYFAGSRSEEIGPYGQSMVSYVDGNGKVLKTIDPLGKVVLNTYDGHSRPVKSVQPEGNSTEYEYDDAPCAAQQRCTHNVKTVRQRPKPGSALPVLTTQYVYESAFNKVANATDPRMQSTSYTYTTQGEPLTVTAPPDASGVSPVETYGYTSYAASGFPAFYLQTSITSKVGAATQTVSAIAYNAANRYVPQSMTYDTGGLNLATTYTYDAVGNLTQLDGPRTDVTDVTLTSYDAERRPGQVTDALGKLQRTSYNADGRVIRVAAQLGTQWLVSCNSFTPSGKILQSWGPSLMASDSTCPTAAAPVTLTDYSYDDLDRKIRIVENLASAEGGNRVSETTYYLDNTVESVKRGVGGADAQVYASYTYTPNGQVATLKDAHGNLTAYQYDGFDRRVKQQYPDPTAPNTSSSTDVEQYAYDENGNLINLVRRGGQAISMVYDKLNRLVARNYSNPAENVTFEYDLKSRILAARFANGSYDVLASYDNLGRQLSAVAGGRSLSFQYDAAGNRVQTTWPDASFYTTVSYDVLNRPSVIRELGITTLATYNYDDRSRRTSITFGNGTSTSYSYSQQGQLTGLAHDLSGTSQDISWTYNRNQVQQISSHSWSNDLYQWTGHTNGNRGYTANGLNQYTAAAGVAISYDANGNLRSDGTWTYGYNSENRLSTANKVGLSASLTYDALGRLNQTNIGGNVSNLLYLGSNLIAEYDGAGNLVHRYVHGPGVDEPLVQYDGAGIGTKTWLYADNLGSVVARADASGVATGTYTYSPFGEADSTAGPRFRYTGQQYLGDLALSYYKARFYSPALGRFLQTDSIGYADDLNLYAYVGNDPINLSDPSGNCSSANNGTLTSGQRDFLENSVACAGCAVLPRAAAAGLAGAAGLTQGDTRSTGDPELDAALAQHGRPGSSTLTVGNAQSSNDADIEAIKAAGYRDKALWAAGVNPSSTAAQQYDVHHVVKQTDPAAAPARAALAAVGIGIHDLQNLVVLPRSIHQSVHTNVYTNAVNATTVSARPLGYNGVSGALDYIRSSLIIKGSYP